MEPESCHMTCSVSAVEDLDSWADQTVKFYGEAHARKGNTASYYMLLNILLEQHNKTTPLFYYVSQTAV